MAEQKTKRYLVLQMEELKAEHAVDKEESTPKKPKDNRGKNGDRPPRPAGPGSGPDGHRPPPPDGV